MEGLRLEKLKKITAFALFVCIILCVFLKVTYLFRWNYSERERILGYKKENVDVVYIGGSASYNHWIPPKAWNDYGMTSYLLSTAELPAESILPYIEYACRTNTPELIILDARPFEYHRPFAEFGLRYASDSMLFFDPIRYKLLRAHYQQDYNSNGETVKIEWLPLYFDIMKYHTNEDVLPSKDAWAHISNDIYHKYNGFTEAGDLLVVERPTSIYTEEREEIDEESEYLLDSLLDYCDSKNLNVLFVIAPFLPDGNRMEKINTIEDIVSARGYRFLNSNKYMDEIKIDYALDFSEANHMNILGAKKYTEFLEKYIKENYRISDHRGEQKYQEWDTEYQDFINHEADAISIIENYRSLHDGSLIIREHLKDAVDISEINRLTSNENYSLIIAGVGFDEYPIDVLDRNTLKEWEILEDNSYFIRTIEGGKIKFSNEWEGSLTMKGRLGRRKEKYWIELDNGYPEITIKDKDYSTTEQVVRLIVYENNEDRVINVYSLQVENGKIVVTKNEQLSDK